MRRVCVFLGSADGGDPVYAETVARLGACLARRGLGLVYGGAGVGLMRTLADAALAAGGEVVGVMPMSMVERERAHHGLSALHIVADMRERKTAMAALADAFVAAPGGVGTMEELFEVWSWGRLGLHDKPHALLNAAGYFDSLLAFLRGAATAGFLDQASVRALPVSADPDELLDQLGLAALDPAAGQPPTRIEPAGAAAPGGAGSACRSANLVAVRDGRLLTVRVGGRRQLTLPGGKPEPGEPAEQALARELREELGLTVPPAALRACGILEAPAAGRAGRLRMRCFTAPLPTEPTPSGEVDELRWVGVAERSDCSPAARAVLDLLAATGTLSAR